VTTTAGSTASLVQPSRKSLWGFGGGTVLAVLLMCGIPAQRRRWMSMLALLWIVVASVAVGCGGGSGSSTQNTSGTTAGNYTFAVTGTDSTNASITTSTTVSVTVQ
jgi:hypothetical protein